MIGMVKNNKTNNKKIIIIKNLKNKNFIYFFFKNEFYLFQNKPKKRYGWVLKYITRREIAEFSVTF